MQITIDTNNLSELDINMLAFLAEQGEVAEPEPEPEPEFKKAPEPEPVKKAAPAKKKSAPAKKADPEPEPEVESEPEPEVEADEDAPTMSDAVAAATQLVSSGNAPKVKAALAQVGARRVSEMEESDIPAFLAALSDA